MSLVLSRAPKKTLRPGQDTIDEALLFIIIKKEVHVGSSSVSYRNVWKKEERGLQAADGTIRLSGSSHAETTDGCVVFVGVGMY